MSTTTTDTHSPERNYLNAEKGIWSWLTTHDHKRIALMYLFSTVLFFFLGGISALIMRTNLASFGKHIVSEETYNILFTLGLEGLLAHGKLVLYTDLPTATFLQLEWRRD